MTTNDLGTDKLTDQIQIYTQKQFTGRLDVQGTTTWSLYFCLGRLVWATGGEHQIRRWYRHLNQYCPQIPTNGVRLRESDVTKYWEYQLLTVLAKRQKITGEQAVAVIKNAVAEVLFDIHQYEEKQQLRLICDRENISDASLTLINPTQAIQESQQLWEAWRTAGLGNVSPNLAPVIKQAEELQKLASPRVYETLMKVIDGKRSLRDLAVQGKQDLVTLTRSLIPYIRKKIIGVVGISDLPIPIATSSTPAPITTNNPSVPPTTAPPAPKTNTEASVVPAPPPPTKPKTNPLPPPPPPTKPTGLARPLVVYVEDSQLDRQIMEGILTKANYGFVSIEDSMQALPLLLQHKPDVIFLDLVMPVANGYEICAQIRRISIFKNTPVIILTGNDGIVDRVRAKIVGATDFLAKPIADRKVLATIVKYLNTSSSGSQSAPSPLSYEAS